MRSEIGSEFWDIPISSKCNELFPESTKWFLSGRTALSYIILDSGIKSVSMPIWCCTSMVDPFLDLGIKVFFYDDLQKIETDAVFVMDYFGYTGSGKTIDNYSGVVIRDLTHSIFSYRYSDADYYFGSLRKWAGFYTGGFAWGSWKRNIPIKECNMEYLQLRKYAMQKKNDYMNFKSDTKNYLQYFEKANNQLKNLGIFAAHEDDVYAAKHLDVEELMSRRRKNAKILFREFNCLYELQDNDCPLFVPVEIEKRDQLRKYFIERDIYCPVHWPRFDRFGKELSLVCDQRYDENDMNRICNAAHDFYMEQKGVE